MDIKLVDYTTAYKEELNTWQDIEHANGEFGINSFITIQDSKLGDYIEFFSDEIDLKTKIALVGDSMIGFVCYIINDDRSVHIELLATNPLHRGKGYSKLILNKLKEELPDSPKITLAINKRNKKALDVFTQFTKPNNEHSSLYYIGLEF